MKSKPWEILEIEGIPSGVYAQWSLDYETRAEARLAALDVVERLWTKYYSSDLAAGISHRVTVGQRDSDGSVIIKDDGLIVTARRGSILDEHLQMSEVLEARPLKD